MSSKSIKAFEQHTGGRYLPALQDRLRTEAKALRAKAENQRQELLAQAARLDDMADELEGKK